MSDPQGLTHSVDSTAVLRITLDRPDVGNALTPTHRDTIIDLLSEAGDDLAVRAIVIGATGKHFCTGADLRAPRPPSRDRPEDAPERAVGELSRMIQQGAQLLIGAVLDCPKPVLASVNGTAAGLGANLAMACDLIVAAESARFVQVFVRRGITPDAGTAYLLPRLVGLAKAKELVFFGDDLSAADAARLGVVNACVSDADLAKVTDEWAARLAAGPTAAIGLAKGLLNHSLESDRARAFDDEARAQELASHSADFQEGVQAFVEHRAPRFRGW